MATATSSTSTVDGAGVNARPGDAGLFVLVQDFETYTASRDPFRFSTDTLPLFQIGAASRLGGPGSGWPFAGDTREPSTRTSTRTRTTERSGVES